MKPRWVLTAAAVVALAILTVPMLMRRGHESIGPRAAAAGGAPSCDATGKAKLDFVLKDKFNAPVHLADYKGKVVLLNFWATWCGPCKQEIPEFVELYGRYKAKGLVIVGISIDDSAEQLQAFTKEWHMQYPVLQMRPEVEDEYGPFYGIPTSFLVTRDGSICIKHLGPATKDQFEKEIQALL